MGGILWGTWRQSGFGLSGLGDNAIQATDPSPAIPIRDIEVAGTIEADAVRSREDAFLPSLGST